MTTIDYFKNPGETVPYIAGQAIFEVGDPDDTMYAVREGQVDIMFNGEVLETVEQGGIFGEKSLIDDTPHTTSAIARTDCIIVPVDEERFLYLVHETPMFALFVMRTMTRRTRRIAQMAMR